MTEDKPSIDVHTVVQVMEQLIPSLTDEMEALVRQADAQKLSAPERRQFISKEYIRKSGELTEQICTKHKLDIREFQAALMFYHDNELFEQALARLSDEQKQRYGCRVLDVVLLLASDCFAGVDSPSCGSRV